MRWLSIFPRRRKMKFYALQYGPQSVRTKQRCAGVHCYTQNYNGVLQLHTIMIIMLPAVSI